MNKKKIYFIGHHKEWGMIATDIIARPLAVLVARHTPITANQISIISFILVLIGAYFFSLGGYRNILTGAILAFAYNVLDMMDGQVARERKKSSILGQWLDGVLGFISFQILIITLVIGLQNRLAWLLGIIAIISYPTQYTLIYYYKAEISPYQEQLPVGLGKWEWLRNIYGLSFFYIFLLFAAIFNKSWWVLAFWAIFGNIYWMAILFIQFLELKKQRNNRGKPKVVE